MAWVSPASSRPCAARAALREQGLGAPLAPTSVSGQLCLWDCLDRHVGSPWDWVRATRCMAWVSTAFLRPRAARAALREQARSYICFGPVMSVPLSGPPCFSGLRLGQGCHVHGLVFPAPSRPCAARAALREQALLLHLFRASYACAIAWSALPVWLWICETLAFTAPSTPG